MVTFPIGRWCRRLAGAGLPLLFTLAAPMPLQAHEYYADGFMIVHPWAEPTAPGVTDVPVYFHLEDLTKGDRLIGGFSPLAERVELRAGDDLSGAPLADIPFRADEADAFKVGHPHLVLRGLKTPFLEGRSYVLMLEFERAGKMVMVISIGDD